MVHSAEDIQKTILFARKFNLHVTIRSSGHDYVGRSTWDGSININLSEMRDYEVKLNSERSEHGEAKVQTGLTWADIYEKVWDFVVKHNWFFLWACYLYICFKFSCILKTIFLVKIITLTIRYPMRPWLQSNIRGLHTWLCVDRRFVQNLLIYWYNVRKYYHILRLNI